MRRALRTTGTLACAAVVCVGLAYAVAALLGYRMLPVLSGSMEPELHVGSLVLVDPIAPTDAREGDVVTFRNPQGDFLTTHRIADVRTTRDGLEFRTQGDAVGVPDPWVLRAPGGRGTFGLVKLDLPLAGYVLVNLQKPVTIVIVIWLAVLVASAIAVRAIWSRRPARREVMA